MASTTNIVVAALAALTLSGIGHAAAEPVLSLAVVTPGGNTERLEFHHGEGWRSIAESGAHAVTVGLPNAPEGKANASGQPLAVFLDRPTGGTFVYLAEEGWKYLGRGAAARAGAYGAGEPLTVFVDGPSGFAYTYAVNDGWKFAGHVGEVKF